LIVTGASGFVAGSVIGQAGGEWEVHALSRQGPVAQRSGLIWHTLDLLDREQLRRVFAEVGPDAVIHAAAVADIDYCETNRDAARQVNADLTTVVVELCRERGVRIVHLSTDTVFDGERGNYSETDRPHPINYYAETKAAAERAVAEGAGDWVVARLALVVGLPVLGAGNSFLARTLAALREGRQQGVPQEEIRTPIDVVTLGRALLELAGSEFQGYVHLAGNDVLDRLVMTRQIADKFGFSPDLVVPRIAAAIVGRAPRPRDVSMNNAKARSVLKTPMLGFDEALQLIIDTNEGRLR
jgi:dTDP-4-dehydrorhamnose reductase